MKELPTVDKTREGTETPELEFAKPPEWRPKFGRPTIETIPEPVRDFANRINDAWHKTRSSILETAKICYDASKSLKPAEKQQLMAALTMSEPTFSKLKKIGEANYLFNDEILPRLPANYSIVYEIACLDPGVIPFALEDGVIHQDMTRAEFLKWKNKDKTTKRPIWPTTVIGTVTSSNPLNADSRAEVLTDLSVLCAKHGCSLESEETRAKRAYEKIAPSIEDFVRKTARAHIGKLKRTAGKRWSYKKDEAEIGRNATKDEIKATLAFLGAEEEFNRIMQSARSKEQKKLDEWQEKYPQSSPDEDDDFLAELGE